MAKIQPSDFKQPKSNQTQALAPPANQTFRVFSGFRGKKIYSQGKPIGHETHQTHQNNSVSSVDSVAKIQPSDFKQPKSNQTFRVFSGFRGKKSTAKATLNRAEATTYAKAET